MIHLTLLRGYGTYYGVVTLFIMSTELTNEQIAALEAMIARRMDNTGETREQSSAFIANFLREYASTLEKE
ncbi:hypothetical protein EBR25_13840 [bacterium]|nr:hypothetical protein [bacterium]